jgi:hypothetical protein
LFHDGIVESVTVVIGMKPNPRHSVNPSASIQLLLPIREVRIDATEWYQKSTTVTSTLRGQPLVDTTDVLVEKCFKTSSPSLYYSLAP